jgi:hypothetical protein
MEKLKRGTGREVSWALAGLERDCCTALRVQGSSTVEKTNGESRRTASSGLSPPSLQLKIAFVQQRDQKEVKRMRRGTEKRDPMPDRMSILDMYCDCDGDALCRCDSRKY